jgi:hypothetical protein
MSKYFQLFRVEVETDNPLTSLDLEKVVFLSQVDKVRVAETMRLERADGKSLDPIIPMRNNSVSSP